jgi:hypothetical protein
LTHQAIDLLTGGLDVREVLLGKLVATPGALDAVESAGDDVLTYVSRHAQRDWGTVGDADKKVGDRALLEGLRLLSA